PVVTNNNAVADGQAAIGVAFTVQDGSGNVLPGQDVTITYPAAGGQQSVTVQTDANGVAQTQISSTRAGSVTVTARINGQTQDTTVTFVANRATAQFSGT
ncbi:Ig-like domain-containing protein, partial [Escherichia coli]